MSRFTRLTETEARTLPWRALLHRVQAEQANWRRHPAMTVADRAAEREFSRIRHAYLDLPDAEAGA